MNHVLVTVLQQCSFFISVYTVCSLGHSTAGVLNEGLWQPCNLEHRGMRINFTLRILKCLNSLDLRSLFLVPQVVIGHRLWYG